MGHRFGNLVDLGSKDMLRVVVGTSCYDVTFNKIYACVFKQSCRIFML